MLLGVIKVLWGLRSLMGEQSRFWMLSIRVGERQSRLRRRGTHSAPPSCHLPGPSTVIKHRAERELLCPLCPLCLLGIPRWTAGKLCAAPGLEQTVG